jgi:hypothetical protein
MTIVEAHNHHPNTFALAALKNSRPTSSLESSAGCGSQLTQMRLSGNYVAMQQVGDESGRLSRPAVKSSNIRYFRLRSHMVTTLLQLSSAAWVS